MDKNGLIYFVRVMYIYFILPTIMKVLLYCLRHPFYKKLKVWQQIYNTNREFRYWRVHKEELLKPGQSGYRLKIEDLGLQPEQLDLLKEYQQKFCEVVIADIDQDGFLLSYFGPIKNAPTVSQEHFLARNRFMVRVVAINGYVGVKKDYNNSKMRFINEIKSLRNLQLAGCNVPAILDVDFDNLTLIFSYILGPVLREELAKQGAALRDRELRQNPEYLHLEKQKRRLVRAQEGRRVLFKVVDAEFIERLFMELSKIQSSGITGGDIKYGNVIIEKKSGEPYWIDFERPNYYTSLGKNSFRILRDQDIERFNEIFGSEKLTYAEIKKRIEGNSIPAINNWILPVHFGSGLRIGSLWDVEFGYGCWHYFLKHHLPPLSGKRILDIGANNAFYGLQMLRQGAREVIGIETDDDYISQGNFVKAAFEWADNTQYNFSYIQADVTELPTLHLGTFDLVTAFSAWCYFAQPDHISNLAQYLNTITDTFILQSRIEPDTNGTYPDPQMSIEDVAQALRDNGFPATRLVAPRGYRRPLIVAGKAQQPLH